MVSEETRQKMRNAKLKNPTRYWFGKKRSPMPQKWRDNIGKGNKGIIKPNSIKNLTYRFPKGVIPWNKGVRGKDSHSWNGGGVHPYKHYRTADYIEWRKKVFERDKYICQCCEVKSSYLHPHHIKSFTNFPDIRYDVNNGITLCVPCHHKVHWGH